MSDREFLKLFSGLMGALVALTVVLIVLATIIGAKIQPENPDLQAVAERIKPIGEVTIGGSGMNLVASANAAGADKGKSVYDSTCAACHAGAMPGAPKLGDKTAWKSRITKGEAVLVQNALKGIGAMPAKGGNASLPDADVKAAVDYMVSKSK